MRSGRKVTIAALVLLSITAATSGVDGTAGPAVATAEDRSRSAFALADARDDPRFPVPVDLVIETEEQWATHFAAAQQTPDLFDGMTIGVVVPTDGPIAEGGAAAVAADEARDAATAVHDPAEDLPLVSSGAPAEKTWDCNIDVNRLFNAALRNDAHRASSLLRRCVPNPAASRQDDVALQRAAITSPATLDALLQYGADPSYQSARGKTALIFASSPYGDFDFAGQDRRKVAMVQRLIVAGGNVDHADRGGITALHMAASGGFQRTVSALLDAGATVDSRTDKDITPLMVAASQGYDQVVDQLLRAGARRKLTDEDGKTAAAKARASGHSDLARRLARPD